MDRSAFKNLWATKKGSQLSEEENSMVDGMTLKELAKIFELVQMEKDWEAEIKAMKAKKETDKKPAVRKGDEDNTSKDTSEVVGAGMKARRDNLKEVWAQKKGSPLSEEESKAVESMTLKELGRIFEMVQTDVDWEAEIRKMKGGSNSAGTAAKEKGGSGPSAAAKDQDGGSSGMKARRDNLKEVWAQKKGSPLSEEESKAVDSMTLKELGRIFEMVQTDVDWEAEIRKMKSDKGSSSSSGSSSSAAQKEDPKKKKEMNSEALEKAKDNLRKYWEKKKGEPLSNDDQKLVDELSIKELTKLFETLQKDSKWNDSVNNLKDQKGIKKEEGSSLHKSGAHENLVKLWEKKKGSPLTEEERKLIDRLSVKDLSKFYDDLEKNSIADLDSEVKNYNISADKVETELDKIALEEAAKTEETNSGLSSKSAAAEAVEKARNNLKKFIEKKKGGTLSDTDELLINSLNIKELTKLFDSMHKEADWEREIKALKADKGLQEESSIDQEKEGSKTTEAAPAKKAVNETVQKAKDNLKKFWEKKKGLPLSNGDKELLEKLNVKELTKLFETVSKDAKWAEEIKRMKAEKNIVDEADAELEELERLAKEEAEKEAAQKDSPAAQAPAAAPAATEEKKKTGQDKAKENLRKAWVSKKGKDLSELEVNFSNSLSLKELTKAYDALKTDDWEEELEIMMEDKGFVKPKAAPVITTDNARAENLIKLMEERKGAPLTEDEKDMIRGLNVKELIKMYDALDAGMDQDDALAYALEDDPEDTGAKEAGGDEEPEIDEAELERLAAEEAEREAEAEAMRELEEQEAAEKAAAEEAAEGQEKELTEEELEALAIAEAEKEAELEAERAAEAELEAEAAAEAEAEAEAAAAAAAALANPVVDDSDDEHAAQQQQQKAERPKKNMMDENGKYILPGSYMELDYDPRSDLPLLDIPPEFEDMKKTLGDFPLLHFIGESQKLNSTKKYEKRILCVTNYAVFLLHPSDGFMARVLEITDIAKLYKHGDVIGFSSPKEFDVILKTPQADEVVELIQAIHTYKKKTPIEITDIDEASMVTELQLKKPNYWKPELRHVHSKEELYNRLVAMNNEDDQLAYLNLKIDPRTQLQIVDIPKEHKHLFATGPFKTDPLLHFFAPCQKINSRGSNDSRFCLVTNSCLYLAYTNGTLQRCVLLHKPTQLHIGQQHIALVIPDEFDLVLKFNSMDEVKKAEKIIKTVYEFKIQKELPTEEHELASVKSNYNLNKPKGWQPRFAPVLQRKDLIDHLRKLGVRPDMNPETIKDQLKKHSDVGGI